MYGSCTRQKTNRKSYAAYRMYCVLSTTLSDGHFSCIEMFLSHVARKILHLLIRIHYFVESERVIGL